MRKLTAALVMVAALPALVVLPAAAQEESRRGSFTAQALPFPVMQADAYYPAKGSCLDGLDGVHKVAEPFAATARGDLTVYVTGLSGDWDLYALTPGGRLLGASEKAQVSGGAGGEERLTVALKSDQEVLMVACNWLGEPQVTVYFDFVPTPGKRGAGGGRDPGRRTTHRVDAAGGPAPPLWQWDPSELEISVGERVVWSNETSSTHHVTPYEGPWADVDTKHLGTGGKVAFVFRKPGEYLYRCDFSFSGVEHSMIVGDECVGQCGRIIVTKRGRG